MPADSDPPPTRLTAPAPAPGWDGTAPTQVGRYRVLAELGRGGMGVVYRADDPRLKRQVAVKVMRAGPTAERTAVARFLREARAQAAIDHDHVVPIYETGSAGGVAFIVMPLLKGASLANVLLDHGPPPPAEAVRIAREIAEGLAAAHAQGLIHRDIKPGNVWLDSPRRRVKILDFGLARAAGPDDAPAGGAAVGDDHLTRTGGMVGTPAYMAPEQARGEAIDPRADLFSLGVLLYRLLTGNPPFTGRGDELLEAVQTLDPPPAAVVRPGLPPALDRLVMRLLAKDPAARPATATAVADELRVIETTSFVTVVPLSEVTVNDPFADMAETVAYSPPPKPSVPGRKRLAAAWVALGVAVLAAGGGFVAWWQTRPGTLVIESEDPAVEVLVKRPGRPDVRAAAGGVRLAAGEYELTVADPKPGVSVRPGKLTVVRGGSATVRVVLPAPPAVPVVAAAVKETDVEKAHRKLAQWVLSRNPWAGVIGMSNPAVVVTGEPTAINKVADLPARPFTLTRITVGAEDVRDAAADPFAGVPHLRGVDLDLYGPAAGFEVALPRAAGQPFASLTVSARFDADPGRLARVLAAVAAAADRVRGVQLYEVPVHRGTAAAVRQLRACPNLSDLSLMLAGPGDPTVADAVAELTSVTVITLYHAAADDTFVRRALHPGLRDLRIASNEGCSGACLADIARIEGLTRLTLQGTKCVGEADLLRPLLTARCRLTQLQFHRTAVTDAGLAVLGGIEHPPTELVLMGNAGATEDGVVRLSARLPGTVISWTGPTGAGRYVAGKRTK